MSTRASPLLGVGPSKPQGLSTESGSPDWVITQSPRPRGANGVPSSKTQRVLFSAMRRKPGRLEAVTVKVPEDSALSLPSDRVASQVQVPVCVGENRVFQRLGAAKKP